MIVCIQCVSNNYSETNNSQLYQQALIELDSTEFSCEDVDFVSISTYAHNEDMIESDLILNIPVNFHYVYSNKMS